ncbi:MBL fold metallo-hydrolase [Candidatus Micrarchaeota archaeon]|nr:MBL fold metallo-hydrolase [Candidatus Micrarchaeota archaeon]
MEMFLDCLGASREVGRSAFMLRTDKRIMLDYGIKIFDESGNAKFPIDMNANPDFAILSHAHLDHSGCIPALYTQNRALKWYATPPTREICEVLWKDSMKIMGEGLPYRIQHFKKALKHWTPLLYNQRMRMGETDIRLLDAGHISGSAMVDIKYKGKRILYTGDFKEEGTFMHKGANYVDDVDILIIESTYATREHPSRKQLEKHMMDEINQTLDNGGNALLPAFALGRTQELIALIRHYNKNVPVFVDGMGREITKIYLKHHQYIRDAKAFRKAVRSVNIVGSIADKKAATREPSVIISSAGMLNGGPMLNYMTRANNASKMIFTGYCVEGTNGWLLQNKGHIIRDEQELMVDMPFEYMDLSAHAGRTGLLQFIEKANPEKVILVHGDKPEDFAKDLKEGRGYDAIAPLPGERVTLSF